MTRDGQDSDRGDGGFRVIQRLAAIDAARAFFLATEPGFRGWEAAA